MKAEGWAVYKRKNTHGAQRGSVERQGVEKDREWRKTGREVEIVMGRSEKGEVVICIEWETKGKEVGGDDEWKRRYLFIYLLYYITE